MGQSGPLQCANLINQENKMQQGDETTHIVVSLDNYRDGGDGRDLSAHSFPVASLTTE